MYSTDLFDIPSPAVEAGGHLWWRQAVTNEPITAPSDDSYCGLQYLGLLVDSGDDVDESDEMNNVVTKEVIISCDNGINLF